MRVMSGGSCPYYDCAKNSFGYCKTTACINPKYSNIGTAQYGQGVQKRIVTNADRIRNMGDEKLAHTLWLTAKGGVIGQRSEDKWLDWLKREGE